LNQEHHARLDAHIYPEQDSIHLMELKMTGETGGKEKATDKCGQAPMSEKPPKER
jgi:hypothetical protein